MEAWHGRPASWLLPACQFRARRHGVSWGMRADVALAARVVAIAELFGQSRAVPEYQAGVRLHAGPGAPGESLWRRPTGIA